MLRNPDSKPTLESIRFVGQTLCRPECVLATKSGDLFVSHLGNGVLHITPTGTQRAIGAISLVDGHAWIPNGIALLPDRTFLVANMGEGGGVWRLHGDGKLEPFILEIDGVPLRPANFVLLDARQRIWISVTTRQWPLPATFSSRRADGYLAVVDRKGARIVADGLAFANELRIDEDYRFLYVVETFGRSIKRFSIDAEAELHNGESFTEFGHGTFPDGIAFDCEGGLWATSVVSNRVIRIDPDGRQTIVLEDADCSWIDHIEHLLESGTLSRNDILQAPARFLKNISSIAFGGPDLRTVYLGSLGGDRLAVFNCPIAGQMPVHWNYTL
jgi:sugar lactone lactonase YvrE